MAQKWHQKTRSQRYKSLKGADPKFLRNMHFAKKHNKKGHNKAKAEVSASTEAISALIIPEAVKAQDAEGPPAANSVGFPKLGKQIQGYTVKGHRLC
ncbi:rCG25576 [Rattus norvegicus]|uniref:Large ribosomal subunit protein eL29 n=1 Tax=Rattus norvegicus TaxID=10116 RepID=A6I225_RAT|nr:rCG25576 [Rattus norvegicus]